MTGNKSQVTIVACINAVGQTMPPFIIFDAKNLNLEWTRGAIKCREFVALRDLVSRDFNFADKIVCENNPLYGIS